jgi:hypothetical protein
LWLLHDQGDPCIFSAAGWIHKPHPYIYFEFPCGFLYAAVFFVWGYFILAWLIMRLEITLMLLFH